METSYSSIPQVDHNEQFDFKDSNNSSRKGKVVVGSLILGVIALSAAVVNQNGRASELLSNFGAANSETLKPSNEFERRTGRTFHDGLLENLVRVHSPTTLELESGNAAIFHVEKAPNTNEMIKLNDNAVSSLDHVFTEIGKHLVKAEVFYSDGSTSNFVYTVTAKVIRAELRDLTEDDRKIYFDALQKFQFTSQSDGVTTYGEKYHSLEYIVRMHLYGAADKSCDHWHDDAGMVTHHVGVTWQFEQSLRMIDPRTASHYWDYTREEATGTEWYDSNIFNDDWFGDNSPDNDLHVVDKGRFAYSPISNGKHFSNIVNPYGLLRSPWNTNPTPYLMRYDKTFYSFADGESEFPTCDLFANMLGLSLAEVNFELNGKLHGPVHIMIGGHWDSSEDWSVLDNTQLTDTFLLLSKFLWRQGFVRTPESCSDDTPHSECMPTCPEGIIGSFDTLTDDESYDILRRTGALALDPISNLEDTMSAAGIGWTMVLKELCHVGSPGEMFTSAAPQDPTFWPLHGNAERLLGALRIYKNRGLINFDETWGYSHFKALPSDTGVVCDWTEATGTLDMPKCTAGTCSGHKEDDLLPFTDLYKEQGDSLLTNADFYTLINPLSDELPYAFDSLFYWEACDEHNLYDEKFGTTKDTETKSLWSRVFQGVWGVM